jgi:hypothetical protein
MALWQLKTEVVPAERISGRTSIEPAEFDEAKWWKERQPPADYRQRLALLLPSTKSWHERLLWYGSEDGDRIDVSLEGGRVESINVRIDCREVNGRFLKALLDLLQDWSCVLIELRYLKVLPTDLTSFVSAVWESPSHQFMEDPGNWLPKLAAEVRAAEAKRRPPDTDPRN